MRPAAKTEFAKTRIEQAVAKRLDALAARVNMRRNEYVRHLIYEHVSNAFEQNVLTNLGELTHTIDRLSTELRDLKSELAALRIEAREQQRDVHHMLRDDFATVLCSLLVQLKGLNPEKTAEHVSKLFPARR